MADFDPLALLLEQRLHIPGGVMASYGYREALVALSAAGVTLVPPGATQVVETGRRLTAPLPGDDPGEVYPLFGGWTAPRDLTQPPPPINGHPCEWVTRTVTTGPWEPAQAADRDGGPTAVEIIRSDRDW